MQWLFPWLLFLHVLGAIVAFGPTFAFAIAGAMGGAEPQHANFSTLVTHAITSRMVLPIGATLPITGLLIILVTGVNPMERTHWWLALGIVLYLITYSFGFFVQRNAVHHAVELTSSPPPHGASGPPPELRTIVKRIQRGGMFMGLMIITIVFLMVVKPQI